MEIYNADANSRISEFLKAELRGFVIPAIYGAAYADIAYVYCHRQIDPDNGSGSNHEISG